MKYTVKIKKYKIILICIFSNRHRFIVYVKSVLLHKEHGEITSSSKANVKKCSLLIFRGIF